MANTTTVALFVASLLCSTSLVSAVGENQDQQSQSLLNHSPDVSIVDYPREARAFNFYPWHRDKEEVATNTADSDAEARFFGNMVNSYLKFAQKFDTSNPFRKIQKYGLSNFLAYRAANVNRAFNSAWYRARSYYYAAQSGANSLLSSLPESTRDRLFTKLVHDGIPYLMNASGMFDSSAVDWAVDTGNKMLDVYKKERQAERRNAMVPTPGGDEGVTSTEATGSFRLARRNGRRIPRRKLHHSNRNQQEELGQQNS